MRKLRIIAVIVLVLLIGLLIIAPVINDSSAEKVSEKLADTPLPEKTEFVEQISQAGKLVGNGNGMQFFGAILIKSELSLEELDKYYADYRTNEWEYLVKVQEGKSIDIIDHGSLQFETEVKDSGYYIVYSWGEGNELFEGFDLRGH